MKKCKCVLLRWSFFLWVCGIVLGVGMAQSGEWTSVNSGVSVHLYDVWGLSSTEVYAVGENKTILFFNGSTWTQMDTGEANSYDLQVIWGTSPINIYAAGEAGTILHYDGIEWVEISNGFTGTCSGIWGSSDDNIYFSGTGSRIVHYDGTDYTESVVGSSAYLDLWGTSSSNIYAVGQMGAIRKYNGTTWQEMESGLTGHAIAGVWGNSASDVFAVASIGEILHSNGTTWTAMDTGTSYRFADVWGNAGDNVYASGASGALMNYNGSEWVDIDSNTDHDLNGVWMSSDGVVFVVGENGEMLQNGEAGTTPPTTGTYDDGYTVGYADGIATCDGIDPIIPVTLNIDEPDAYMTLMNEKAYALLSGTCTHVYGSSSANTLILKSNSGARLFNFVGTNTIRIEAAFSLFIVSRSGATVTFEGSDGTILVVAATLSAQSIEFADQTLELLIESGSVMLGDQVIY